MQFSMMHVIVRCAGGFYNESTTKLYCMVITNANILSNSMENSTDDEIRYNNNAS